MKKTNIKQIFNNEVLKRTAFLFLISLFLLIQSCAAKEETEIVEDEIQMSLTASIPNIPSSISSNPEPTTNKLTAPANLQATTASCTGHSCGVYEGVRGYIAFGEGAAELVKEIMGHMQNVLTQPEGSYDLKPTSATEPSRIVIAGAANGYDHQVDVFFNSSTTEEQGASIYFSQDSEKVAKGMIQLGSLFFNDPNNINMKAQIIFDGGYGETTTRSLDVTLSDIDNMGDSGAPTKIVINYTENGDIFNLKGASYHPQIPDLGITDDGIGIVYNFRAQGSLSQNIAVLDLALPKGNISDTTNMFDTYSVSNFFTDVSYNMIQNEINNQFNSLTAEQKDGIISYLSLQGETISGPELSLSEYILFIEHFICESYCEKNADFTETEFTNFIDNYVDQAGTDDDWVIDFQKIRGIVNPAYFDSTGFVQTWDAVQAKGVDAAGNPATSAPAGYDGLDSTLVSPYVPSVVAATELTFF
ncbi:MAG: hypothetical protein OEZ22_04780 [Spirochaetia bacterium]|nr:hypothetical protein [Spirochaetia bacterium]